MKAVPARLVARGRVLGILLDHAQVGIQADPHRRVEWDLQPQVLSPCKRLTHAREENNDSRSKGSCLEVAWQTHVQEDSSAHVVTWKAVRMY